MRRVEILLLLALALFLSVVAFTRLQEGKERVLEMRLLRNLFIVKMEVLKYRKEHGRYPETIRILSSLDSLINPVTGEWSFDKCVREDTTELKDGFLYYIHERRDTTDTFYLFGFIRGKKVFLNPLSRP